MAFTKIIHSSLSSVDEHLKSYKNIQEWPERRKFSCASIFMMKVFIRTEKFWNERLGYSWRLRDFPGDRLKTIKKFSDSIAWWHGEEFKNPKINWFSSLNWDVCWAWLSCFLNRALLRLECAWRHKISCFHFTSVVTWIAANKLELSPMTRTNSPISIFSSAQQLFN